jgi:regulatory protein
MAGIITALELQKKNKERVSIFLDGKYAFGISLLRAAKLKKGQYLSEEQIAELESHDEYDRAYDRALNYLTYRPRSEMEIARYLSTKGWDQPVTDEVIDRLKKASLLDDAEFARFWIDNRQRFRPRGLMALRYELKSKGLSDSVISEALEDVEEEESAYKLAYQRVQKAIGLERQEFRRQLSQYLSRRGFSFSVINAVLSRIEGEIEISQDDRTEVL